jgi:hypothetical protein
VIATIIDWAELRDVVIASLAAGVGMTVAFSLAITALTRSTNVRRQGRVGDAWAYTAAGVAGLAVAAAAVPLMIALLS